MLFLRIFLLIFTTNLYSQYDLENHEINQSKIDRFYLQISNVNSIKNFLENLNQSDKEYFQHFNLVYSSKSLQGGDFQSPRTILSTKNGEVIFAFNGDKKQKGFHQIEALVFNSKERVFDFIEYEENSNHLVKNHNTAGKCMQCHTSDLRPVWRPYDLWLGAYGSHDDALIDFKKFPTEEERYRAENNVLVNVYNARDFSDEERFSILNIIQKEFDEFMVFREEAKKNSHSRYHYLQFEGESPVAPYIPTSRSGEYPLRPNLNLTEKISRLNAMRVAHMIEKKAACYENYRSYILSSLMECEIEKKLSQKIIENILRHQPDYSNLPGWREGEELSHKVFALSLLNIEKEDLNLSMEPKDWNYFVGYYYMQHYLANELYQKLNFDIE